MKLSLPTYSAWISLAFLALVSCRSPEIVLSGERAKETRDSMISGSFEKQNFKAKIIFRDKELSGRMLVKNSGDGNFRFSFYNELGMTYLEGSFSNTSKHQKMIIKNIAPAIDYRVFIKNFEKCLKTAFTREKSRSRDSIQTISDNNMMSIKLKNGFRLELF